MVLVYNKGREGRFWLCRIHFGSFMAALYYSTQLRRDEGMI